MVSPLAKSRRIIGGKWGLKLRMWLVASTIFAFYSVIAAALGTYFIYVWELESNPQKGVGYILAILVTLILMYVQYRRGTKRIVQGKNTVNLPPDAYPEIHRKSQQLATEMGIEPPTLKLTAARDLNACAAGSRSNGTIVLHRPLVNNLTSDELEGILAHEMAHLKHRDSMIMTFAAQIRSIFQTVAKIFLVWWGMIIWCIFFVGDNRFTPIRNIRLAWNKLNTGWSGKFIRLVVFVVGAVIMVFSKSLSRHREYVADEAAVNATGKPVAMQRALLKLKRGNSGDRESPDVPASLCIHAKANGLLSLSFIFATHPSIDSRVRRIEQQFC